jgi:hypothetical protein
MICSEMGWKIEEWLYVLAVLNMSQIIVNNIIVMSSHEFYN